MEMEFKVLFVKTSSKLHVKLGWFMDRKKNHFSRQS